MLRFTTSNSWDTTLPSAGVLLLATALLYSYNSASAVEPLNSSLLPIKHSHYTHFIATYRFIARSMRASSTRSTSVYSGLKNTSAPYALSSNSRFGSLFRKRYQSWRREKRTRIFAFIRVFSSASRSASVSHEQCR